MADVTASEAAARSTPRRLWDLLPIDAWAALLLVLVVVPIEFPFIRQGISFNDPSWYFHFGNRTLHGDVPYRDYIFQVGPLPVYVDAAFQAIFGERYLASLFAGMLIKLIRLQITWMLVRRLVDTRTAIAFMLFCAFDPLLSFAHHWSTGYAQLFITAAGLCVLVATRSQSTRRELAYLALAGFSASLVVSARQSAAVMIGVVLFGASIVMLLRKEYFTPRRFLAMWGGFAAGFVVVFGALAVAGALGPGIQQLFLDAPQKKAIHGVDAVLDAISGGALVEWSHSWWGGFLVWLGLPCAIVAGAMYLLARDPEREIEGREIAMVAVPVAVLMGALMRTGAKLEAESDLPRSFLTVTTALAVLWPDKLRRWLGLEPIIAIALGALPLASDWALEMSFPGRGWGDTPSLVTGGLFVVLASTRLGPSLKRGLCIVLAAFTALQIGVMLDAGKNPFAKREAREGVLADTHLVARARGQRSSVLRGLHVSRARAEVVKWLTDQIPVGSTCFVYGNTPVLYDITGCKNPTRVDTTAADFITAQDAENAVAVLRANPPDFIIAHEKQWMSPPLNKQLADDLAAYDGLNPRASRAMHRGLQSILGQYEEVGYVADVLGPELAAQVATYWDSLDAVRLYRRKR